MKKNICMSLILTLMFLLSGFCDDLYIQIGNESAYYSTGYIPASGVYDYSWSQVIYLNSEIGGSKYIDKLSYCIKNSPENFSMNNQTIYMKHTSDNHFPSASYDDPESCGFTKVFEGSVTWDGSGWSDCIEFDEKFKYNGSDNLIIYWHNKHADARNGSPSFKYESFSDRAKYAVRDRSFPEYSGYLRSYRSIIRAYYNFTNPVYPMDGEKNVAVYVEPTVFWENADSVVSNALFFSDDESAVVNTSLTAMVLSPSTNVYNNYTNSATLSSSVYYWRVLSFSSSGDTELSPVWSFSTEADPINSFPLYEGFENEGIMPDFWDEECLIGSNVWRYQYGGNNGNPAAPRSGAYNAVLQSAAAGQKNMLVTPVMDLSGHSNPMLTFWYAMPSGNYQDELRIYYKTSKTNLWNLIPNAVYNSNTKDWSRKTLILPEVSDKFYIGFEGTVNGGNGICIDDVRILTSYSKLTLDVRDADGQPAPQSYCTIYAPSDDTIDSANGNTDSDGLYTEDGLIPGNIRYIVDNPFFNVVENQISLSGGSDFTQRVDLSVSTHITGVIRENDDNGNRIEGVSVKLYSDAPDSKLVDSETTDAFGRYNFSRMVNGDYRINAAHSAYFETNKNINVTGSANHDLALKPREGNFVDIYVQVLGILSGWAIADCSVELVVKESGGSVIYNETSYTDSDGNLFFRGVPAGLCQFTCNSDGFQQQGWWESFTSKWLDIQNDKLVNIRLKPNKCDLTVDLDFFPVDQYGNPESPVVYVQNFWIEARGCDPETGAALYPARTALTDHAGMVTFEKLPSLPTKITVRRPGFQTESVVVTPNEVGNFPQAVIKKMRPLITPQTVWNLSVLQDIFKCFEVDESDVYWQSPVIGVQGIKNSNSEGFKADGGTSVRYIIEDGKNIPFKFKTDHEQKSAWGQSRYNISTLDQYNDGYIMVNEIDEYFYFRFDFDPFVANIVEGQTNDCSIQADVTSGKIEGTLLVSDELSAKNKTIYKPRADTELHFVLHESVRQFYKDDVDTVYKVTTDNEGKYSIILPPGIYGIKIPAMVNYWGYQIDKVSFNGRMNNIDPWPYASLNSSWEEDASFSGIYNASGYSVSSGDHNKLDLYVNKCKYTLEMPVTETSALNNRLLYMAPDTSDQQLLSVKDCVESQTEFTLSGGAGSQKVEPHSSGMRVIWKDLDNGTYTLSGENHPYLSSTSDVSVTTFTWGTYPGDPPSSQPPYGEALNETPLPMIKHQLDSCEMLSESNLTNPPSVVVTYATEDDENPTATTTRTPQYVKYKDHPDCVYSVGNVDRPRADKYYIFFTLLSGETKTYEVDGDGSFAVNTILQAPVGLPVSPFNMTVKAIATDNPDNIIPDVPFKYEQNNYNTEKTFLGLTTSTSIGWNYNMDSEWIKGYIEYYMCPTSATSTVFANMYCKPRVKIVGKVINSVSGNPIGNANISLIKADGVHNQILTTSSYDSGEFYVSYAYTRDSYILNVMSPGYLPYSQRIVLNNIITGVEDGYTGGYTRYFKAETGDLLLSPIDATVTKDGWDRLGHVLHGVKAAGTGETSGTTDALSLTVQASAVIPSQTYPVVPYDNSDGTPAATSMKNLDDIITEIWLVDARKKDSNDNFTPYLPADSSNYFPENMNYMPPASDPEKISEWLDNLVDDACIISMFKPSLPEVSVSVEGIVNVADLHAGSIYPALIARTKKGGCRILALESNLISSVELPRWLAFAADTMASAAGAQTAYGDLKETYTSKVPDGKLSALPEITGGISEEGGYLTYEYGLGVEWEEGAEAPAKGGLKVGPGMLGLKFEAEASIAFEGETQNLVFNVGGRIGKEDIDLSDYMPSFLGKLGVEGNINKVGGLATTKRSSAINGAVWSEKELETMVGAYIDLMLKYNLEGITGKIPYIGPFITAADATGLLKLYGRLDLGGRVQNRSVWRTIEPERPAKVGEPPYTETYAIVMRPDDELLTPNRHCFGGQENHGNAFSNEFLLGVAFAAGFEGSALNDHLNVHAGIEITGNSNDVQIAGEPSLIITPNTFGDWPPLKRVQGDVNAFCKAKLDAYVTEIEKSWSVNLARIDYEFTTESLLTMADISVDILEKDIVSTEFSGTRPNVVRNIPKGSSFALLKNVLVFGMYNSSTKQTDLVLSMADGDEFEIPSTIVADVEGLGLVALESIGDDKYLLIWEERPGINSNSKAYSVIKSSLYDGSWHPVKIVAQLNSYLNDMKLFISSENISLIYFASPESKESNFNRICAVPYTSASDSWNTPEVLQLVSEKVDYASACVGGISVEPGQILYVDATNQLFSMYWDGFKTHISGGNELCNITSNSSNVAICSGGSNEILYVTSCGLNDMINLHAYIPDPNREPANPSYDWYGRECTNIWPYLGPLTTVDDSIYDLENCWLQDCSTLLSVWSKCGALYGNWVSPINISSTTNIAITKSSYGNYKDIRIIPMSNNIARVAACYVDEQSYDIRVFSVTALATANSDDADGDGIPDYLEQLIVDADPNDDINDIRDVHGEDDFDGDGFSNAEEWANNTRADSADSYPQFGVWVEAVVPCAEESSLQSAIFTINRGNDDSAEIPITVNYNLDGSATFGTDYNTLPLNVLIPTGQYSADVEIKPIKDNLAEETEDVIITLKTGTGYVLGSDTQAVVRIIDTPKGKWQHKYFSQIQLADPNIIGDDKDPDNDGIPNYLEMALGLDPMSPDVCQLEMVLNEDNIQFKYTRDPDVQSALIKIMSTTNLVVENSWDQADAKCIWRESRADGLEDVYYQESTNYPSGYYRLRVEDED